MVQKYAGALESAALRLPLTSVIRVAFFFSVDYSMDITPMKTFKTLKLLKAGVADHALQHSAKKTHKLKSFTQLNQTASKAMT